MSLRSGLFILATALILNTASTWARSDEIKATQLKGVQFITVMNGNTLSAINEDGVAFRAYFLKGGIMTYKDENGLEDKGQWLIKDDGQICLTMEKIDPGQEHCAKVYLLGNNLIWKGDTMTGNGVLEGTVK